MLENSTDVPPGSDKNEIAQEILQSDLTAFGSAVRIAVREFLDVHKTANVARVLESLSHAILDSVRAVCKTDQLRLEIAWASLLRQAVIDHDKTWVEHRGESGPSGTVFVRREWDQFLDNLESLSIGIFGMIEGSIKQYEEESTAIRAMFQNDHPMNGDDLFSVCDRIAWAVFQGADALALDKQELLSILAAISQLIQGSDQSDLGFPLRFIRETVGLQLAKEMFRRTVEGESRFYRLALLITGLTPSKSAGEFLRRVARCYLFGFDTECVVMCRSTLDAEFCAEIPTDDCISVLGRRPKCRYTLEDRIETAIKLKRIDSACAKMARRIKDNGNRLVHANPSMITDSIQMIEMTLKVLTGLGRAHKGQ